MCECCGGDCQLTSDFFKEDIMTSEKKLIKANQLANERWLNSKPRDRKQSHLHPWKIDKALPNNNKDKDLLT